jgi:hypothetical protein
MVKQGSGLLVENAKLVRHLSRRIVRAPFPVAAGIEANSLADDARRALQVDHRFHADNGLQSSRLPSMPG